MFNSLYAILAENPTHRPGKVRVAYQEPSHPLQRMLIRSLQRQQVIEELALELEKQEVLGDITIQVGPRATENGLHVDVAQLAGRLVLALAEKHTVEEACFEAATSLGTELARQVGRLLKAA